MDDSICECPKCGRAHRDLGFGAPPSLPHHTDLCILSVLLQRHMDLSINQPGYRLNEWLKQFIEVARRGDPKRGNEVASFGAVSFTADGNQA